MISAERMKSVRMAPDVICFSASSPDPATTVGPWASWPRIFPQTFSAPS